ncbi:hypothetical protein C1H46_043612 [Malus baccata]|uniref:Uncharacterized protein n=1 Tax=Malus baccata TaxID=106549 RepID=A0A540K9E9_MALBA|nr:hypothetical protein C1H46_043612 [Malus baccata]
MGFQGYIIGIPATNVKGDVNSRIEYAHRMALISDRIYESTTRNCSGEYVDVDPNNQLCLNSLQAFQECTGRLDSEHILAPFCPKANDYNELTVLEMNWNWKADVLQEDRIRYAVLWANDINVRKAFNIREGGGHTAPEYNPKECFDMFNRWLGHSPI